MLSQLDVMIKLDMLLGMFIKTVQNYANCSDVVDGVATMFPFPLFSSQPPVSPALETPTTPASSLLSADLNQLNSVLSCFIMQLDLLVKQVCE